MREEAGRLRWAGGFPSVVEQPSAAQARAKTGSSLTAKGRASSEQRSMATPGQKSLPWWGPSNSRSMTKDAGSNSSHRAAMPQSCQIRPAKTFLCVSWYKGNVAGTQHCDFAQHLLYIPWTKQEVVSRERTLLTVLSRSFRSSPSEWVGLSQELSAWNR